MIVGIHVDPTETSSPQLDRYEAILDHNGISHVRLDAGKPDFWEQVGKTDLFIFHWYHKERLSQLARTIIPIVEKEMGIPCYPNMATCWHFDDKIREYYLLRQHSFPVVPTWVFWDKEDAMAWLEKAELPVVFKLKGGAGSKSVVLVENRRYGRRLIRRMFGRGITTERIPGLADVRWKDLSLYRILRFNVGDILVKMGMKKPYEYCSVHKYYALFQAFMPNNAFDLRVNVIGQRAFGNVRRVRENDFRASGSMCGDFNPDRIDPRCIRIAFDVSRELGFQSMAYDFLFDQSGQPGISEISYTFPDFTVWSSPGYWDERLHWHDGHFWPQYCVLADALNLPDLKQPEMVP